MNRKYFVSLVLASLSAWAAAKEEASKPDVTITPLGVPGYALSWHDEFNAKSLDLNEWQYRTDSKHWSTQHPRNVSILDGRLRIALKKENANGKEYTGGGVISKRTFKHGYFEARLKIPNGKGWHSAFWLMMHDGSGTTNPKDSNQEVDIIENDSINPMVFSTNIHQFLGGHRVLGGRRISCPNLAEDFHVFGCEFTPRMAKFFFDGQLVNAIDVSRLEVSEQHLWLSAIASPLGRTDAVDDTALPAYFEVDWVRFYEKADSKSGTQASLK